MTEASRARDDLLSICRAFRVSAVLFAAIDLDLFDHIGEEGATTEDIGDALAVPPKNLRHLLDALVALHLLVAQGNRYHVPSPVSSLLRRGTADYLGDFIRSARNEYAHWMYSNDILRGTYTGPAYEGETLNRLCASHTLRNVEQSNRVSAESMLPHLEPYLGGQPRILDLGGGHGYHSELLLRQAPQARVTIVDLPQVIEYCGARQASNPNRSRMELIIGDALELDYDQQYDVAMVNDVLVYFNLDEKLQVLRRVLKALKVGGVLASINQTVHNGADSPSVWAIFSLRIFLTTGKGYLQANSEMVKLAQTAGFDDVRIFDLQDQRTLLIGRRCR